MTATVDAGNGATYEVCGRCGKVAFPDRDTALLGLLNIQWAPRTSKIPKSVYWSRPCRTYHLTSAEKTPPARRARRRPGRARVRAR